MTQYLTSTQFAAIPTGLDTSGADMDGLLTRASAWADRICRLPVGVFAQLPQTETHRVTLNRLGELSVRLDGAAPNVPVEVTAVSWGARPTTLTSLTSLGDVWVAGGLVTVPLSGYTGSWAGSLNVFSPSPCGQVFVQVGYTSGWVTLPPDLLQAVAFLASALIITPDADSAATPFPGASARADGTAKSSDVDYLDSAERILGFYARRTP